MNDVALTIDGLPVTVWDDCTVLQAAREAGVYIPTLCDHPDLPPGRGGKPAEAVYRNGLKIENRIDREFAGCGLCVVEIAGADEPQPACVTPAAPGMAVVTDSPALTEIRRKRLAVVMAGHPHACLTCAQARGCSRTQCSANAPEEERCCPKFGDCELQRAAAYIGLPDDLPRRASARAPVLGGDPLLVRDYNLCIGCTRCVRACEDLRGAGALGFVFDEGGMVRVGSLAPGLAESGCRFCTACVEVCPTGALMDQRLPSGDRARALVPCRSACPAGVDAPEYLRLIAQGQAGQALAVIREGVPLPGVLGRVCTHPCEEACRRGQVNQPVSICLLKRFAADQGGDLWRRKLAAAPPAGKKVGILGAGPAGLAAAFFLARKGRRVTIFEAEDQPGGMLRHGIPAYRLPEDVLAAEIKAIVDLGVDIRTGARIGSLDELAAMGFDAVFISTGAQLPRRLDAPGADQPHVLQALDLLKSIRRGREVVLGPRVLVIGGGNAAVDAARSALRQGARSVGLVCLERREDMPAHPWEVEGAEAEGVRVHNSWGPAVIGPDGTATFQRCIRVYDDQGRFSPTYDDSETAAFEADQVIIAIGQAPDLGFAEGSRLSTDRGLIVVDPDTLETSRPGVFAGGDATANSGSVIAAVAAGRKAASAMDAYLGGDGEAGFRLGERPAPGPRLGRTTGFAALARLAAPERPAEERKTDYGEVCLGFSREQARAEAARCLQCHLRLQIQAPPRPPEHLTPLDRDGVGQAPEAEGVVVLFDEGRNILAIAGTGDIRRELQERLDAGSAAAFFAYEKDPMYSKAESEKIQVYLQQHGSMPPGDGAGDDLDDLF